MRFTDLSAPLLEFHPTRQLFGAIKARGIYYNTIPNAPAWQKDLAVRQYENEATIEPPIMEYTVAVLYAKFGENTAIPRAISATFWLIGAVFIFLLAKNITGSSYAAASSLAFMLMLPYAVTASRVFQPDPLMVMLIIIFWWSIENWGRNPNWMWTIISGLAGGLAIFVKLPAVFFIVGGAVGSIFAHLGLIKSLKLPQTWVITILGIMPPAAYLYYGIIVKDFLGQQFNDRVNPELWFSPYFYLRWFLKLENLASILWIILALLSWLVFTSKPIKIFLAGLWVAYFVYGMTFAHYISSHDYYSLPLIPIAALSLAPITLEICSVISRKIKFSRSLQLISLILLLISISLVSIDQYLNLRLNDYRPQAAFWAEVGNTIGHQPGVIALTTDYGYPLAYYGWQNSTPWPNSESVDNFNNAFTRLTGNKSYFLITDFEEFDRQPELQKRLTVGYPVLIQGKGFIVFDLLHSKN